MVVGSRGHPFILQPGLGFGRLGSFIPNSASFELFFP